MLVSNIAAIAITAMMASPAIACKCFRGGRKDNAATQRCCRRYSGVFRGGDDCLASSISEDLRGFRSCCGGQSDCDFRIAADGKVIPVDALDGAEASGENVDTVVVPE